MEKNTAKVCQNVAKFQKRVKQQEILLGVGLTETDIVFATEVGHFFGGILPHTYDFWQTRIGRRPTKWKWKKYGRKALCSLFGESSVGGDGLYLGSRLRAPFFLLSQPRRWCLFSFIRYWVELDEDVNVARVTSTMHATSSNTRIGDWVYPPREPDSRYSDFFTIWSDADLVKVERPYIEESVAGIMNPWKRSWPQ